nr:glycosyltransferase [Paracidovorax avenae]
MLRAGYKVHLAVGELFNNLLLPRGLSSLTTGLKLNATVNVNQLAELTGDIEEIIRKNRIDIIHLHPFNSFIPGFLAAERMQIPAVLTLHGPTSLSGYSGPMYEFLLKSVILPNVSLTICISEEIRALAEPYLADSQIKVIPNGVDFSMRQMLSQGASVPDKRWCVVSRLDSFKIKGIFDFVIKAKKAGIPGVLIVGDGAAKEKLEEQLNATGLNGFVEFYGMSGRVKSIIMQHAGVAGMGRVVLEGIAARKSVALVGYDGLKGIVDQEMLNNAGQANFSGRNLSTISADDFAEQLAHRADFDKELDEILLSASKNYDQNIIWQDFFNSLQKIEAVGKNILSEAFKAMQASQLEEQSPFLQSGALIDSLENIVYSPRYYSSYVNLSFEKYRKMLDGLPGERMNEEVPQPGIGQEKISTTGVVAEEEKNSQVKRLILDLEGVISDLKTETFALHQLMHEKERLEKSLNTEVMRRDKRIGTLEERINVFSKEVSDLNKKLESAATDLSAKDARINSLLQSKSWKVTSPLRIFAELLKKRNVISYGVLRNIFFALPAPIRKLLESPASTYSSYARRKILLASPAIKDSNDLTWEEFSRTVLSRRHAYRGVFIQEVVIDWNVPLYQRPQHMAAAMAKLGYLVIYRTDNWANDHVEGFREVEPNVWLTNKSQVESIENAYRSVYSTAYAHTPEQLLKNSVRGDLLYEYIDHIDPEISGEDENIKRLLALKSFAFSGGARYIVASAKKLYEEAREHMGDDRVIFVPNGVDTAHYRNPIHLQYELPESLTEFRKRYGRIVGYFGALAPWLWYEEIEKIVSSQPDIGFVFIGPDYYGGAGRLPRAANVLYLGAIEYKVLPAYAHSFDVCFIPFKPGEIARTTSPLKLFEYFALEKPVVVTSEMLECIQYSEVLSGDSAESLSDAIHRAMKLKDDASYKEKLAKLADENDWRMRAAALVDGLERGR